MLKLTVLGKLGREAVVNNVNGKTVINFSVAHTEKYKDQQGNLVDRTTWVECAFWSEKTAIAPYLKKGTSVLVEGGPYVEMYTNKEGKQNATLRLRVNNVYLAGNKEGTNDNQPSAAQTMQAPANTNDSFNQPTYNTEPTSVPFTNNEEPTDLPF
jgi:single-strand DNA-binding protein